MSRLQLVIDELAARKNSMSRERSDIAANVAKLEKELDLARHNLARLDAMIAEFDDALTRVEK